MLGAAVLIGDSPVLGAPAPAVCECGKQGSIYSPCASTYDSDGLRLAGDSDSNLR